MIDWQPIETAPKDWTDILAYDGHSIFIACFGVGEWLLTWGEDTMHPTHWKPLPEPPK